MASAGKQKKTVSLPAAIIIVIVFTIICIFSGYVVGYKYFWQKFDKTARVDREIFAYSSKVKQNPQDLDSLVKLAWLAYDKKEYELVIQSSNMVLTINPNEPNSHYVLGLTYFDQKKFDLAGKEFEVLIQNYPKNTLALLGLSKTYLALEQPEKAIAYLEQLINMDRTVVDGHLFLGKAYVKIGQKTKALEQLNEVLRFSPDNQEAKDWINSLNN